MNRILLLTVIALFLTLPLLAQTGYAPIDLNPFHNKGLFNNNKLQMSHSVGFEAGSSSSGYGYYLSRYTNHINYRFSSKLDLDIDLSLVNFGSATTAKGISFNSDNSSKIIPEFSLKYKPSDSVSFEIQYRQAPTFDQYRYSPWYSWLDKE
ncbi:MAG TPA: hypothetical protein PKI15_00470 [Candidatus Cloacimonadota bacterium]|nr:hypothetical protein [Candidatus Cloacimonadota bacterium]